MELLKHFRELTLHPANAKELKALILQLAVQGKLTAEWRKANPNVEPAEKLLERVKDHNKKQLLIRKRKIKNSKTKDINEVVLHENWTKAHNFELFSLIKGKNPKDLSESEKKYPYLDIEALDRGNVRRFSNDEKAPKCSESDILVVCDGSRSGLVLNGKSGIVGSTLAIIETPNEIQEFVKLIFLQSFEKYNSTMKGAAIPHLDTQKLLAECIPLPPLEEQKAIVAVVEQLFKEMEQLEQLTESRIRLKEQFTVSALRDLTTNNTPQEWEALKPHFHTFFNETANIKKLRETILQLAVQGKLTARWRKTHSPFEGGSGNPDEHDAALLLQKIKTEKARLIAEGKIKKEKPLPEITEDEKPYELPEGWVWCRMQELCPNISSGSTPPKQYFSENGTPYLKVYNIRSQQIDFVYKEQFVDLQYHQTKLRRSILNPGDVIMNIVGPPLGKVAIIPDNFPEWNCNQAIAFFKPVLRELNIWLYTFLCAGTFLNEIELIGTAGQDNISVTKSKNIKIPLPSLKEQKAIVSTVNRLMALCDALEQETTQSKAQAEQWMKGVVREVVEKN
jgi:type I restriction enzyme, S subunit